MNTLTTNVLNYQQEKDMMKKDTLFSTIYENLKRTITSRVHHYTYSLRGDAALAESIALDVMMQTVEDFKYTGQEFVTYYIHVLENRLIDAVREVEAAKRSHNTCYDISLSEPGGSGDSEFGEKVAINDRLQDDALAVVDDYSLAARPSIASILDKYATVNKTDADVLELLIKYSAEGYKKADASNAIVAYFNADKYAGKVQRFVSHAKKRFKEYAASEFGYEFNF